MASINMVGNSLSGATGTGSFVGATSPTLVTPNIGAALATSITFGGSVLSAYNQAVSFSPTFTAATVGDLSVSYATQIGFYTIVGSKVYVNINIKFTPTYTTASGTAKITLPLTVGTVNNEDTMTIFVSALAFTGTRTQGVMRTIGVTSTAQFQTTGSAQAQATLTLATSFPSATQQEVKFTGIYFI
jgi:hypothetical protein